MKDEKNKQPQQHQPQQQPRQQQPQQQHSDTEKKKGEMKHPMDDAKGDIENPDQQEQPGKKKNVNDDPDQTKKKVPNMHK
jgi:hypothetical protein